ncbi:MAG: SDR family NAD(P)-dependent oxidoreductase [Acholeplasmataceae bacterium]|nr:SDR family NAD(P)-dependent oxidoreductase [Acholeplasmataceae bacterium]
MSKVAVVTGATSGIGKAVVELLLKEGIHVVGLGRNTEKIDAVKNEFQALTKHANLDFVLGDLSDNRQVNLAAKDLKELIDDKYHGKIDILMNIAGIVSSGRHLNEDGNEVTFAINHLAVFLLTYHMIPCLKKSSDPRILVVSSLSHYWASINWKNIQSQKLYNILKSYKRSKLYNVLFVKEFSRHFNDIKIYAIDPGLVKTELGLKRTNGLAYAIWNSRMNKGTNPLYPAGFMIDVATKNEYNSMSGHYIKKGVSVASSKVSYSIIDAKKLWEYSEELTQIKFKF